jgi:hypothetical protein
LDQEIFRLGKVNFRVPSQNILPEYSCHSDVTSVSSSHVKELVDFIVFVERCFACIGNIFQPLAASHAVPAGTGKGQLLSGLSVVTL